MFGMSAATSACEPLAAGLEPALPGLTPGASLKRITPLPVSMERKPEESSAPPISTGMAMWEARTRPLPPAIVARVVSMCCQVLLAGSR